MLLGGFWGGSRVSARALDDPIRVTLRQFHEEAIAVDGLPQALNLIGGHAAHDIAARGPHSGRLRRPCGNDRRLPAL